MVEKPMDQDFYTEFDLIEYINRLAEWSDTNFGPGNRTKSIIKHLRKEIDEVEKDPYDTEEWIDVVILALEGARRHGASPTKIVETLIFKQLKNSTREYPDWRTMNRDEPIEHIRKDENGSEE